MDRFAIQTGGVFMSWYIVLIYLTPCIGVLAAFAWLIIDVIHDHKKGE